MGSKWLAAFHIKHDGEEKARKENTGEIPKCLFLLKLDYKALFYYNGLNNSCTFLLLYNWLHYVLSKWFINLNHFLLRISHECLIDMILELFYEVTNWCSY